MPVLPSLCLLAAALTPAAPVEPVGEDGPLNVIVLLADDLGWMDLGCQGSTFYETPHLDALAASGMRFTQAYAGGPVCSPTRAALMAGKTPARMDTTDWFGAGRAGKMLPADYIPQLPLEEVSLAEALRTQGYRTAFFGKWHLGKEGYFPEDQGFEVNVGGHHRGSPPGGYFAPFKNPKMEDSPPGTQLTERLTDEAVQWMESVHEEPFLLYLSWYAVHTPLQTKPEYKEYYQAKRSQLPDREGEAWGQERERKVRHVQDHAVYAGMIQSLDESVGRLLGKLEEMGLTGRTLVVFTSDNGGLSTSEGHPTSNLPLRGGKGWLYEGGIREPMLVRWPGVTAPGSVCHTPVISMDVYPTVLSAAGLDPAPEQHVDGMNLLPLLQGGTAPGRALYWHYPHYGNQGAAPSGAVRSGHWKLVEWFEDGSTELFNLDADPGESQNLATAQPGRTAALHAGLERWRVSVQAQMPRPNPNFEK